MRRHHDQDQRIASLDHPRIKPIRRLRQRAERDQVGRFFVDGIRFVIRALQRRAPVETLVVAPDLLTNAAARRLVAAWSGPCLSVTADLYARLAPTDAPQGLGAVVGQRWTPLQEIDGRESLCWVALQTVQSPGNLGTILRTSEAVGGAGLILIGDDVDPYHLSAVRATLGSLFGQRLVPTTLPALAAWKVRHGVQCVGTAPRAGVEYRSADYRAPLVLVMGWERQGMSDGQRDLCDLTVHLPMVGAADSLNLGVATGVMLYQLHATLRQHERPG